MAQETFAQIWNRVLLYAPDCPAPMAQDLVKDAYRDVINYHYWSELFQDGELTTADEYTDGTVDLTNGSAAVAGNGTAWDSSMVGRQLLVSGVNTATYYTITAVGAVDGLTLDRVYEGPDASGAAYTIAQYYVEFPSDLVTLDTIRDYAQNWRLRAQYHQQAYLDKVDTQRSYVGSPITFVSAPPRVAGGVSYPRYEFWPKIPGGTHLVYRYIKDSELSAGADRPISILNPQVLVWGALAKLALWPGLADAPNPYFNMDLHATYMKMFEESLHDSEMDDLDRSQTMIQFGELGGDRGYPVDANFLQSHGIPF